MFVDKVIHTILETEVSLGPKFSREGIRKKQTDWRAELRCQLSIISDSGRRVVGTGGLGWKCPSRDCVLWRFGKERNCQIWCKQDISFWKCNFFLYFHNLYDNWKVFRFPVGTVFSKKNYIVAYLYSVSWRRMGCLIMVLVLNFQL